MEWSIILDIVIILLLLVDIILYRSTYGTVNNLTVITSYIYNYLKEKDGKF